MAKLIWALPCIQVLTDQETNTTSYITSVEGVGVSSLPGKFPNIFVGTNWGRTSEEEDTIHPRLRVLAPSGEEVNTRELEERSFEDFQRYRINVRVGGFDMAEAGEYTIVVEHKDGDSWVSDTQIPVMVQDASAEQEEVS